jgi:cytoskeletal protein RodZ
VRLRRLGIALLVAVVVGAALEGCGGATTTTVVTEVRAPATSSTGSSATSSASSSAVSPASSSRNATTTDNSPAQATPQVFRGSGQQVLGTIVVPTDSTISWNCPNCSNTNFIINNANSDANAIPTNALDQTQGVDTLPAGTYHTVVVDTTAGPWTVAIGTTAPAPTSSSNSAPAASAGTTQCDPNITAANGADCPFAENTFYEYWAHNGDSTFSVYAKATGTYFTVNCTSGAEITCTTAPGGTVTFSQSSVSAYTPAEATAYADSGKLGP